ncbi:MAG: hypothetical protein IJN17_02690 [Clostridia bacterium]|nr:hypothetical protein [Clostridia bacterium]
MKLFKKLLGVTGVCLLTAVVLAGCGGDTDKNTKETENESVAHEHTVGADWVVDKDSHFKLCTECNEKTEVEAHDSETGKCSVCGVAAIKKDGACDLYFYDDNGNWIKCIHYAADGSTTEDKNEYEYFEDGNIKTIKMYKGDRLAYEAEYGVDTDGYNYEAKSTQYNEDGTKYVCESDSKGDLMKETMYKADGSIEYDYRMEYTYGDNAKKMNEKKFSGDKLIQEIKYIPLFVDSWGGGSYKLEVTTYNDDGTTTVEYFNENGEPLEDTDETAAA